MAGRGRQRWGARQEGMDMIQPWRTKGSEMSRSIVLVALAWGSLVGVATAEDAPALTAQPPASMRVHVDPSTGAIVTAPVGPPAAAQMAPATSHSAAGLVEVPSPGGGVILDLQGRFLSPVTATVAPDGAPHAECHGPQAGTPAAR